MAINRITYSGTFLKSLQPFVVQVTKGPTRDIVFAGNMQRKECTLFGCRLTGLITSSWRSLNIYHQDRPKSKKYTVLTILFFTKNIILNQANNNNNSYIF
ncbi:hypothetical protein MS3_00000905 [Schistosoma haematobium]|uniref:Uncharacterized protein n=1 Tax=Schistosoma haematobium TaxID=6185 RepID=A0A922LYT4_SCHHA|nr:hypothetical protein MS3_00000905 [Schistosoma haematobium]KAH9596301.1 hypothetical protein MS3_00000905 [Schistosoma haematobium]